MRKTIITITLGILMLATVMAMYSGESMSFETNLTNPVYTVTGNNSNLEGMDVTFENEEITISLDPCMAPDNFTMIFFDNITNEVIKEVRVGGGSRKVYVDNNITTYVPEYVNKIETKEVEVEKIVDNTTVVKTGYELQHIFLGGALYLILGGWAVYSWRKSDVKEID